MKHPLIQSTASMNKARTVLTLTMPYPTTLQMEHLTPHAKGKDWRKKAAATQSQRMEAKLVCGQCTPRDPWDFAIVTYLFVKPDNRILDHLNMASRFKAAIDGIVDAGLLPNDNDKYLKVGGMESAVDKEFPRVVITMNRISLGMAGGAA